MVLIPNCICETVKMLLAALHRIIVQILSEHIHINMVLQQIFRQPIKLREITLFITDINEISLACNGHVTL